MELTDTGWVRCHEELEQSVRGNFYARELGRRIDVADIVQDGLLQIWQQKIEDSKHEINRAWLRHIAKGHTAKNVRKHTARKRDARREIAVEGSLDDSTPSLFDPPDVHALRSELIELVNEAIEDLEPISRYIVKKHGLEGWALSSVAESLGRTPRVCRRLLASAFEELRWTIVEAIGHLTGELPKV